MVGVKLGAKAKNYDFNVSDVDFDTFNTKKADYAIRANGITISQDKANYVTLEGQFKLMPLMDGDYEKGIKRLDSITVVENGKVNYQASSLHMSGKDVATSELFKEFLAAESYTIRGNGFGNDITGATRKDVIIGFGGNDVLEGREGNDRLYGDTGRDRLVGGIGNDILSGGKGADTFVFAAGDGRDVITDFQAHGRGQDVIDLTGHPDILSFDDLVITSSRSTVWIDLGDDMITLKNVKEAHIDASDFQFWQQ
ncbi:hypothetical protein [Rhizobium sp.]